MRTVIPPPILPPEPHERGNFYIKSTVYEEKDGETVKRYTGYSQDSDIIPKTVEWCMKNREAPENICTRPVVTSSTGKKFTGCIVVDDIMKKLTRVEWF